jgi:hypothetical protein
MRGLSSSSSSDARLIGVSVSNPQSFATLFDRHARAICVTHPAALGTTVQTFSDRPGWTR